jgi:hypothetical protein
MTWAFKFQELIPSMAMSVRIVFATSSHDRCWSLGVSSVQCHLLALPSGDLRIVAQAASHAQVTPGDGGSEQLGWRPARARADPGGSLRAGGLRHCHCHAVTMPRAGRRRRVWSNSSA